MKRSENEICGSNNACAWRNCRPAATLALATGDSVAHMLAVDYSLKPVLSALKAQEVIHGVFAEDRQITCGEDAARLSNDLRECLMSR